MPSKYATSAPPAGAIYATPGQAAFLAQMCYESLKRAHRKGEPVGLTKLARSRATRFHLATLKTWLDAQAGV